MAISADSFALTPVQLPAALNSGNNAATLPAANASPSLAQDQLSLSPAALSGNTASNNSLDAATSSTNGLPTANSIVPAADNGDPSGDVGTYKVQPGDKIWTIAAKQLGDPNRWPELYQLNKNVIGNDPRVIVPGQVLTLPTGDVETPEAPANDPMPASMTPCASCVPAPPPPACPAPAPIPAPPPPPPAPAPQPATSASAPASGSSIAPSGTAPLPAIVPPAPGASNADLATRVQLLQLRREMEQLSGQLDRMLLQQDGGQPIFNGPVAYGQLAAANQG